MDPETSRYVFHPMKLTSGEVIILDPDGGSHFADPKLNDRWLYAIGEHLRRRFAAKKLTF